MRGESRWRSERGQSTAFVLCMLFVSVLFVGVVVDIGQATNRRIALQYVADAGAYTGASVMAVGYNQLAQWNTFMQYAWELFTAPGTPMWAAFQVHVTECTDADIDETLYYTVMEKLKWVMTVENLGYSLLARSEAKRNSVFNAGDLFPGEELEYRESDLPLITGGHDAERMARIREVPDGTLPKAMPIGLPALKELAYTCVIPGVPPTVEARVRTYPVWYQRDEGTVDSFVWVVTAPSTRAYLFDRWFGGWIIPEMKAVAVAKPVGGSIEEGTDRYLAKMVPVATVMLGNRLAASVLPGWMGPITGAMSQVPDDRYDRGNRVITH